MNFRDIIGNRDCKLTFAFTISRANKNGKGAVLFSVYDADKLLTLFDLDEIAKIGRIRILNSSGQECFISDNYIDYAGQKPDIVYTPSNGFVTVEVSIPDSFYKNRLVKVRITLMSYITLFLVMGVALSVFFAYKRGKPLKKLIDYLSANTQESYIEGNEFDYIRKQIMKISDERDLTNEKFVDKCFAKLLFLGFDQKEAEEFYKVAGFIPNPFFLVMLKNNNSNDTNWDDKIISELDQECVIPFRYLTLSKFTMVLFFDRVNLSVEAVKSAIMRVNRESQLVIKGAVSVPCTSILEVADVFARLREVIKYVEPGMLLTMDDISLDGTCRNFISEYYENSRSFYELLRSGDTFEVTKLIYYQWYELCENPSFNNDIASLFYYQIGILSQVSIDVGFTEMLPAFWYENDAVTNAVSIAQYAERLCEFIKKNRTKAGDQRTLDVLNYINDHCYEPSFYMAVLVEKFELSSKTLNQLIKNMTGMTFSVYVSELRLAKAEAMLRDTEMPIADIASQCGFETPKSFLKAFKKKYGVAPTIFRSNYKLNL